MTAGAMPVAAAVVQNGCARNGRMFDMTAERGGAA